MSAFHGVIPPIITPYDRSGGIHSEALQRLIDWYAEAGCHGLWVCGGTGEGVLLSQLERDEMITLVNQYSAGRLTTIFHVAAPTTAQAVAAARRCQSEGLDAICSVPPYFYGKSTPEVVDYYKALADATDRPIFLYNLPDASGLPLTLPLVEAIVNRVPSVIGIKQSAGVVDYVAQLLKFKPDLTVLIGRGETTLAALTLGATGVVCASLCMAPERFVAVYQAFQDGDLRRAMDAQRYASSVKDLYDAFPVIASTKWVNSQQLGIDCGAPRAPLAAIAPEREAALRQLADELELLGPAVGRIAATEPVAAAAGTKPR